MSLVNIILVWFFLSCSTSQSTGHDQGPADGSSGHDQGLVEDSSEVDLVAQAPLALQLILDTAVARNDGFGGGTLHVESTTDGVLWDGVSGLSIAADGVPMESNHTYELASITKTFTATVVLLLVEEGHFALDDTISELSDAEWTTGLLTIDGQDVTPQITVRQLLAHTSGLPDYWNDPPFVGTTPYNAFVTAFIAEVDHFWTPAEILTYVPGLTPIGAPGHGYHYSDTGFLLLGFLVEQYTGRLLHQVFRERLFVPLGMADTYMPYREQPTASVTESHRYEGAWDMHGRLHQSADWAGGGLVSSNRDLVRFLKALSGGEVFSNPETLAEMQGWIPTGEIDVSYGLGVVHLQLDGDLGELWGHDGYGNAFMYYWPQRQIAIVGTLNQSENDWWPLVEEVIVQEAGL